MQSEVQARQKVDAQLARAGLFRLRLEQLQILAGRNESAQADAARASLQEMLGLAQTLAA